MAADRRTHEDLAVPAEVIDSYHLDLLPLDRPARGTADLLRLDGKVAIVTGGGGSGLGAAICHRLAEQGASVAVVDVDPGAAEATAGSVSERWGAPAVAIEADIGDPDSVSRATSRVASELGGLDILVNNAGGSGSVDEGGRRVTQHGHFSAMTTEDLLAVVRVNLVGTLLMTRAALDVMVPRRSGRVINIASEGGKVGMEGIAVYSSCKAAIIGFTRNLAREAGRSGVTTVAVCPGVMVTDRTLERLATGSGAGFAALDAAFARTSIGRFSVPDEVASVVAYLASEAGAYIHATAVSVGGGMAD